MASMTFSTTSFAPTRTNPIASSSSLPFIIKSSFASSNSAFFQPLKISSNFPRLLLKPRPFSVYARAATEKTIYDFTVKDIERKDVSLSKFKGKVLLIVNVASRWKLLQKHLCIPKMHQSVMHHCGVPQDAMTHLLHTAKMPGLEVLAFPCNQFGMQEPGSNQEIKQFACTRYKAEFPIFDKVDVNGPFTAPVYQFLKSSAGGFLGDLVKWNFEKFLVDKNGKVVERYPPTTSPFQIEKDIQRLLAA